MSSTIPRATSVVRIHEPGGPGVLRYEQADQPGPAPGQVLVRQAAVGVNYADILFRRGEMKAGGYPFVGGLEAAGTIEAVGEGVEGFAPGDRVGYAFALGAYAGLRTMGTDRLVKLPDWLEPEAAAAVLLKGMTAEYLVRRVYPVQPGDVVLVHAAAGGVGSLVASWAKHLGATGIGMVGSGEKAQAALANGCDHAIVYTREDFVARVLDITGGAGAHVSYDGVGRDTFAPSLGALRRFGKAVLFGWASGRVEPVDVQQLNAKSLSITGPSLGHYTSSRELLDLSARSLFDALASGAVRAPVAQRYPLSAAADAHADLEARRTRGPVVLVPAA